MRIFGRQKSRGGVAVVVVFALVLVVKTAVITAATTTTTTDKSNSNSKSNNRNLQNSNNKLFPLAIATILDLLKANGSFTTLVQAITAPGQDHVESMVGPKGQQLQMATSNYYTLFAPNNNAFANLTARLPLAVRQQLFTDEQWRLHLQGILLYHIVPGIFLSNNLLAGATAAAATTSDGASAYVTSLLLQEEGRAVFSSPAGFRDNENAMSIKLDNQGLLKINDIATVVFPDLEPSNGVLHMIDQVLIPPFMFRSIFVTLRQQAQAFSLNTLLNTILQSGLADVLSTSTEGPYTLFAPTNEAFANLPYLIGVDELMEDDPQSRLLLREILLYHIVPRQIVPFPSSSTGETGAITAGNGVTVSKSSGTEVLQTMNSGKTIEVTSSSFTSPLDGITTMMMMINGATVLKSDVLASNGIIHVIDKVLLPPGVTVPVFYKIRSTSYDPATSPENTPSACMEVATDDDGQRLILGDCTATRGGGWRTVDQVPAIGVGGTSNGGSTATMIQSELDIDYCLQAGSDGGIRSVLRIERCDNNNPLQNWIFPNGRGTMRPAGNPNLCVVWRGLNSNVGLDPITLLSCDDDNAVWKLNWVLG